MQKSLVPALLIVLFTVVITGKAGPLTASPGTLFAPGCTVLADVPRLDRPAGALVATGSFRCDRPGADITMRLSLQRRNPVGGWTALGVRSFAATGANTTRDRSDAQRTREVRAPCGPGTYRTLVTATVAGQRKPSDVQATGRAITNPCA